MYAAVYMYAAVAAIISILATDAASVKSTHLDPTEQISMISYTAATPPAQRCDQSPVCIHVERQHRQHSQPLLVP